MGAGVTLSRLQARLADLVAAGAAHETGAFAALLEQLRYFAGVQIRNVATVGGCGALKLSLCFSTCVARHDCRTSYPRPTIMWAARHATFLDAFSGMSRLPGGARSVTLALAPLSERRGMTGTS